VDVRKPDIEVHIGELVLHGIDPADRHRVGDAVQSELARLLGERGLTTPASFARPVVSAGSVRITRPNTLGAQVARALYGVLRR
jgi:hypothetical protein